MNSTSIPKFTMKDVNSIVFYRGTLRVVEYVDESDRLIRLRETRTHYGSSETIFEDVRFSTLEEKIDYLVRERLSKK